jgi:hypothetical protein
VKILLQDLFDISCVIFGMYTGYLLVQHIFSVLDFGEELFLLITLVCTFIWFGRHNKDGLYRLFKDIHQSNLDDIEEQQLEEQIDQAIVKEQIKTSLEAVALFSLILYLLMCGVLFVFAPDLGLVNWLILLSVIPVILLIGNIVSTKKDMWKNYLDNNEEREATIIK